MTRVVFPLARAPVELESRQSRRGDRPISIMFASLLRLCFTVFIPYVAAEQTFVINSFKTQRMVHSPGEINQTQLSKIAAMTNTRHMNEVLDNICIPRVVGSSGHKKVKNYLKKSMKTLGWSVETDTFNDQTPNLGTLEFENIIAKLDPNASRYLVLACHYDSLYTREGDFVGAIDSAVPCAQLLNLATVMNEPLKAGKTANVSLMFVFFDGEEAFRTWGANDSIYGAKHLARKWSSTIRNNGFETDISDLDKIDLLILLDLLGAAHPIFYNYFRNTTRWYSKLVEAERSLANIDAFRNYAYGSLAKQYFQSYPEYVNYAVEDDHIPFLRRNVPIIHLIPYGFPSFWHTTGDNRNIIDMDTTENLNKILRVFVASYLNLHI